MIAELSRIISAFHSVSPTLLSTVTSIYHKPGFFEKTINVFHSVKLALFTIAFEKKQETARNLETTWKITEKSYKDKVICTLLEASVLFPRYR